MDGTRFDALTQALAGGSSRRRLLAILPLALLGALPGAAPAMARKHRKHKHHHHRHRHQNKPFCAGRNTCTHSARESECNAPESLLCNCMRTAETHEPVCVGAVGSFDCAACAADEVCVDLAGCSPDFDRGCARPCADPR